MGMAEICLVMSDKGVLHGLTGDDDRSWKRFKRWAKSLAPGEIFSFSFEHERDSVQHRRYMKMVRYAFHHWEPAPGAALEHKGMVVAKDFERFRKDVLILAGFFEAKFALDGSVVLEAQSLKFKKMPQTTFEQVYAATFDVLLKHVLTTYTRENLQEVVQQLERFGGTSSYE